MSERGRGGEPRARVRGDETGDELVLRTVTALLGAGVLLHEIQLGTTFLDPHLLVVVAAVVALTRPGIPTLVGLFAMLGVELLVDLPSPFNHTVVMGIVGGGIALWWLASPRAAWRRDAGAFLARVGPVVRVTVLLIWALAFFAKLNHAFFETPHSCAIWILEHVPLVTVPDWASSVVVLGTLALEGGVPLLLLLRATRPAGVAAAWVFHLVAALGGHTAFSAIALPLYLLFLDPQHRRVSIRWVLARVPRPHAVVAAARHPVGVAALVVLLMAGMAVIESLPAPWDARGQRYVPTLVYLPLAAIYATALVAGLRRRRDAPTLHGDGAVSMRLRGVVPVVIVLVVVLNAASPYLGLRTGGSLTMYSNLHTEPGEWNHLIVPEEVRVFGWQDDLVLIHDAEPAIRRDLGFGAVSPPARVPQLLVRRAAARDPDALVALDPGASWVPVSSLASGGLGTVHDRLIDLRAVPVTPQCQV